jgi:DNA (cytosine-5)-methyltransferase 1
MNNFNSIDLFSGCGGLTLGMKQAGFNVLAAIEIDPIAVQTYRMNHPEVYIVNKDIRNININEIKNILDDRPLHLLAGCPPCQGFSSIRRLNKETPADDPRNDLIWEYFRFVKELLPYTIMLENVPGLKDFPPFQKMLCDLEKLGYNKPSVGNVWIQKYGIPQRRKRLIAVASKIGELTVAKETNITQTVRDAIGNLESVSKTKDSLHKVFPIHSQSVLARIKKIPKNGGSRTDLPYEEQLECHKKSNVGFNDIYGRLSWDSVSSTMTGGCLNPSKGRFLHPDEDRCISAREAALLQTFPKKYLFPVNIGITKLSLLIGNALPPLFSKIQSKNIIKHLKSNLHVG